MQSEQISYGRFQHQSSQPTCISRLAVSDFDRTSSFLTAIIFVLGFVFLVLLTIWIDPQPIPTIPPDPVGDFCLYPAELEFPLTEQPIEFGLTENSSAGPEPEQALIAIPDAVSKVYATLEFGSDGVPPADKSGTELGPEGIKKGKRFRGPPPPIVVPRAQRWRVTFENADYEHYRNMLLSMGIDIGLVRLTNNEIVCLNAEFNQFLAVNSTRNAESNRLYFVNANRTARRWDNKIANELELSTENSAVVHFYSRELQEKLLKLETKAVEQNGRELGDIQTSRFSIVESSSSDSGFRFQLESIEYRNNESQ